MSDLIEQLIEAHLQHELSSLRGDALAATLANQVSAILQWSGEVQLDDVATREQIKSVIERYVIDLRVSGGITELSGEMSRVVFSSRASADTRIDQLLTPASYDEFADKVIALAGVRQQLIALVARSTTFTTINARMAAFGLLDLLAPALPIPRESSLSELAGRLADRWLPGIERTVALALGNYLERHRERLTRDAEEHLLNVLDPERLRSLFDELWDGISSMHLSEAFALVGEQDIEDFVVLVYEFWLRYRKTDFFRRISSELVDYFFDKYGKESLLLLIEEMGVSENMITHELTTFLGPILEQAARSGFLARQIRARLDGFYRSPRVNELLALAAGAKRE